MLLVLLLLLLLHREFSKNMFLNIENIYKIGFTYNSKLYKIIAFFVSQKEQDGNLCAVHYPYDISNHLRFKINLITFGGQSPRCSLRANAGGSATRPELGNTFRHIEECRFLILANSVQLL